MASAHRELFPGDDRRDQNIPKAAVKQENQVVTTRSVSTDDSSEGWRSNRGGGGRESF